MKKYLNIKTGAVIDSSFTIKGEHWVLHDEYTEEKNDEVEDNDATDDNEVEVDLLELTKPKLIELAKEHKIEIDERAKKEVIIEAIVDALG